MIIFSLYFLDIAINGYRLGNLHFVNIKEGKFINTKNNNNIEIENEELCTILILFTKNRNTTIEGKIF